VTSSRPSPPPPAGDELEALAAAAAIAAAAITELEAPPCEMLLYGRLRAGRPRGLE